MANMQVLNKKEMERLAGLAIDIIVSLTCNLNDHGVPCHQDRMCAVAAMKEYLEIHGYKVSK